MQNHPLGNRSKAAGAPPGQTVLFEWAALIWMLCMMLILAGCAAETPETVNPATATPPVESSSSSSTASINASSSQALMIAMASEILDLGTNPFLNKLPITVEAQQDTADSTAEAKPAEIPLDPFQGIALLGVVYHPQNAYALLSLAEGNSASNSGSEVVKVGDTVFSSGAQLKVTKIERDRIDLQETVGSRSIRSLFLPDIIGFNATTGASPGNGSSGLNQTVGNPEDGLNRALTSLTETRRLSPGESNRDSILKLQDP